MQHWNSNEQSWVQRNMELLRAKDWTCLTICMRFESECIMLVQNYIVPPNGVGCDRLENMVKTFMTDKTCEFRDARLKLVPRIVEGPWLFKKAVPDGAAIVAKNIPTTYFEGDHYLE